MLLQQQHRRVDQDSGLTSDIERCNCTLRQRVSRLVSKSWSFSKKLDNHIPAIWNFVHHDNATRRSKLGLACCQAILLTFPSGHYPFSHAAVRLDEETFIDGHGLHTTAQRLESWSHLQVPEAGFLTLEPLFFRPAHVARDPAVIEPIVCILEHP